MSSGKIDEQLRDKLFSANTETVLKAVETVKEKGNHHYLPILFDLLNSSPEKDIETAVTEVLGSVKEKQSVNSFIRILENEKYQKIRKTILTACWQNGLDFSTFLPVFIDLIINEDWETAFEAFTVADNFEFIPPDEIVQISVQKIHAALPEVGEQKHLFLSEILKKFS